MKIAILTHSVDHGAFATITRNLVGGFVERDVHVDVLYLAGPPPEQLAGYPDGVRFVNLARRSRSCWWPVARHLRRSRPDALISLGWVLNPAAVIAVAVARTGTRLILNEQSSLSYKSRVEHRDEPRLRVLGWLATYLYPRAAAVIGASLPIVADLEREIGIDSSRVALYVVPNPVNGQSVSLQARDCDRGLIACDGEPLFVNVARHARQKNLPLLLRAFRRYVDDGGAGLLVLIGAGPQSAELQELAVILGLSERVVFRGPLRNPFPQMAGATAFVLSSEEEGFGLVLVEAMALGVPVISTDCPGGPAEILLDGRAGLLVPSGDEQALAGAMRRIADDPDLRSGLSAAALERAADFKPSVVADQWLGILRPLTASPESATSYTGGL